MLCSISEKTTEQGRDMKTWKKKIEKSTNISVQKCTFSSINLERNNTNQVNTKYRNFNE